MAFKGPFFGRLTSRVGLWLGKRADHGNDYRASSLNRRVSEIEMSVDNDANSANKSGNFRDIENDLFHEITPSG